MSLMNGNVKIRIKFFGALRDLTGLDEFELELPDRIHCDAIFNCLRRKFKQLGPVLQHSTIAVNGMYAARYARLHGGDIVAVLPSFGAD
jgi:molybdopterin converting factor small subunit